MIENRENHKALNYGETWIMLEHPSELPASFSVSTAAWGFLLLLLGTFSWELGHVFQ